MSAATIPPPPSQRTRSATLQHAKSYAFFRFRSAMFPAVQFASNIWMLFLIGGIFFQIAGFIVLAVALYAVAVLFQIVTLPVEFDASSRARRQLNELGLVIASEGAGVKSVLKAAAWTYVAGALAAVAMLLYYLSMLATGSSTSTSRAASR